MAQVANDVTTLVISTDIAPIAVPAAAVAEVLPRAPMHAIPMTRPWTMGFIVWRGLPVTVISFEALVGGKSPVVEPSRLVVFYPLSGCGKEEFFAIAANHEPHSLIVGPEFSAAPMPYGVAPEFVAGALQHGQQIVVIPNLEAMKQAFYA